MHMPRTIIENSIVIGLGRDGTPLHSWNEGPRRFEERYVTVKAASGISYGVTNVFELEPCAQNMEHGAPNIAQ